MGYNILFSKETEVSVRDYIFRVYSIETHWAGDPPGKMEDMPGNFLEQTVSIIGCTNPTHIEAIAAENNLRLPGFYPLRKETTNEPRDYAKLKHEQLVEDVQNNPERYIRMIKRAVKEFL